MSSVRRQYPFQLIEPKWQRFWDEQQTFRAWNPGEKIPVSHPFSKRHGGADAARVPKYYILDMFPYPSGAGLHVGHPEGYTATDILARYRRARGFNVLHPMGWDSFGLPAEQYAVKTGQHPRKTTEANITTFKRQIQSLGFSYDWSRELATTDPEYFRWTQWIFLQIYHAWFNPETNRAEPISTLRFPEDCDTEEKRRAYRDAKRLAYVSEAPVNWCPELGTVLANEEVIDGKSEVGGFPVIRKPMRQWLLRITALAERLLNDLETIEWSHSLKEMQRNWIGRSEGAEVKFQISDSEAQITVFTTRPDTLFGATYMVLSPEHKLVAEITTSAQHDAVKQYQQFATTKSDLERTELAKDKTGVSTGAFAINPVNGEKIPIWIADYVLASYGTGAIMAVPAHDDRDFEFARKFGLRIQPVVLPPHDWLKSHVSIPDFVGVPLEEFRQLDLDDPSKLRAPAQNYAVATGAKDSDYCEECVRLFQKITCTDDATQEELESLRFFYQAAPACFTDQKGTPVVFKNEGILTNSGPFDGMPAAVARREIVDLLQRQGLGKQTINYKLRDWLFSRQRYWGEPFPIVWKRDAGGNLYHEALPETALPLLPPALDDYKPTADGQPPLARAKDWLTLPDGALRETNTMPQWAGSCWYYLRYLDARRKESFVGILPEHYWMGGPTEGPLLTPTQWAARLRDLCAYAATKPSSGKHYVTYAVVGEEEARRLKSATGLELAGYRRFIDDQAINHILAEHGDEDTEARMGQAVVTEEDLVLIADVVLHPDSVRYAGETRRHLDAVLSTKRVNGWICCVEEVRTGDRLLAVKTFYKKLTTGAHAVAGLDQTSETFRRSETNQTATATAVNSSLPGAPPAAPKPTPGVDLYVGGTEHAVLHLLYARFWHKVLYDLGHVSTAEPFFKLVNQGLILGEDGQKMSKARGNVVNPDAVVAEYGADSLRLYEMFMGPLEMVKPWNTKGVEGVYRFLGRVWRLFVDEESETAFEQNLAAEPARGAEFLQQIQPHRAIADCEPTGAQLKTLHACIKKVTEDLDHLGFNTAISALMVFTNEAMTWETRPQRVLREFLLLLQPFAPHLAEELAQMIGAKDSPELRTLAYDPWPKFDPALLVEATLEIPVQVNGKLRGVVVVPTEATGPQIEAAALADEKVKGFIAGKTIKRIIVVRGKLLNLVVA